MFSFYGTNKRVYTTKKADIGGLSVYSILLLGSVTGKLGCMRLRVSYMGDW